MSINCVQYQQMYVNDFSNITLINIQKCSDLFGDKYCSEYNNTTICNDKYRDHINELITIKEGLYYLHPEYIEF